MRIALTHPFSWPEVWRGAERYLHDLAWYLAQAGHEVEVVTGTNEAPGVSTSDGVVFHRYRHRARAVHRLQMYPVDTFGAFAFTHFTHNRYDLVHGLTPTAAIAGSLSGHRTVYTDIGARDRAAFRKARWSWTFFRTAVRLATACTALSRSAAAQVEALTARRPVVLPPGVRIDRFLAGGEAPDGSPRILFCSDASEVRKGLDRLFAAVARLQPRFPGVRVQLAGPGDHRWALGRLGAAAEAVAECLEVFPPDDREGLLRLYRDATVTAMPSSHEAFGLVLVESLASGTPIACGDSGGPAEIVEDGIGATARHGDAGALAEALERTFALAGEPSTAGRCVARARRWDWLSSVGPAHERLYEAVVERGRRAGRSQVWEEAATGPPR